VDILTQNALNSNLAAESQDRREGQLAPRVTVISPHLDDAILSLGSTIAHAAEAGARIDVLTVFGDLPGSNAPASPWDRSCGFLTEGQAASARREEDREACSILGARPRWLNFGSECYERRGTEDDILSAVASVTADADIVLLPGFPLAHRDHHLLSELVLRKGLNGQRLALYVEQPYALGMAKGSTVSTGPSVSTTPAASTAATPDAPVIPNSPAWTRLMAAPAHRRAKARAVRCYQSQLRRLGLKNIGLHRMLWREAANGGEAIAWLP
jgi:LmbE family N-acetylglucosaminyl deacetylase